MQVGIHSALANKLMKELLQGHHVPCVNSYAPDSVQSEIPMQSFLRQVKKRRKGDDAAVVPGKTRIDFQVQHNDDSYTFVEVKSVTYTQQCMPPCKRKLSCC
ncbi:MAG: DNA/RNA nuclease SfsA [Akkermansiaceae bacterium]|nr:DNA/RNA nuclease SfsA [Akkermansiaceae bacterium]